MPLNIPYLDLTQTTSPSQILPCKPNLSSHSAEWKGIILRQYSQLSAHEFPEYYPQQHLIIIHQQQYPTRVERKINGKKQSLLVDNSDIAFIPAQNSHGAAWQAELELTILILNPDFLFQTAYEWVDPDEIELLPPFSHGDSFINQIALQLKNSLTTNNNRFYAESMATALSAHLIQHYSVQKLIFPDDTAGLSKDKLKRVKEYICDRLTENVSLQDISHEVGLSRSYFARLFKQSMGITPYQYIIEQRIRKAKQLLKQDLPLVEIAFSCGFANQSAFNKTFRKCMGTTPRKYRLEI